MQVRFFERVKLERRIKQLEGKADKGHTLSAEELQALKQNREDLQVGSVSLIVPQMIVPQMYLAKDCDRFCSMLFTSQKERGMCPC